MTRRRAYAIDRLAKKRKSVSVFIAPEDPVDHQEGHTLAWATFWPELSIACERVSSNVNPEMLRARTEFLGHHFSDPDNSHFVHDKKRDTFGSPSLHIGEKGIFWIAMNPLYRQNADARNHPRWAPLSMYVVTFMDDVEAARNAMPERVSAMSLSMMQRCDKKPYCLSDPYVIEGDPRFGDFGFAEVLAIIDDMYREIPALQAAVSRKEIISLLILDPKTRNLPPDAKVQYLLAFIRRRMEGKK